MAQFFKEHSNVNFSIVPVASYGSPPRSALCTKRSLEAALKTVSFEIGSRTENSGARCVHITALLGRHGSRHGQRKRLVWQRQPQRSGESE